jgi:hypothetical protein
VLSPASVLLAASLVQIPFGSSFETRVPESSAVPASGSTVGNFLVVARKHVGDAGTLVTLRPLALGELAVPLADAQPSRVEVVSTLPPDASPRLPVLPAPPPFPWQLVVLPVAGIGVIGLAFVLLLRRRRESDPLAMLRTSLQGLASPAAWAAEDAADRLAGGCRAFLHAATAAPCGAMTTHEISSLLATSLDARLAAPFARALDLADGARFAGTAPEADAAVALVNSLLTAAPEALLVVGGRG